MKAAYAQDKLKIDEQIRSNSMKNKGESTGEKSESSDHEKEKEYKQK